MDELRLRYRKARKDARKRLAYAKLKGFDVEGIKLPEGINAKTPDIEILKKIQQMGDIGIKATREKLKAPVNTKSWKVLEEVRKKIGEYTPLETWSTEMRQRKLDVQRTLIIMFDGAVMRYGIEAVGERLEGLALTVNEIIDRILYDSKQENVDLNLNELAAIINGTMIDTDTNKALTELSDFIK